MFPLSQVSPSSRHMRHRQQNYTWDHSYMYTSETTLTPSSSSRTYQDLPTTTLSPAQSPSALPSRISALNRRAAIVSANLAHLTAVVKPLETTKLQALSDDHLSDMWEESVGLDKAMEQFREQMDEVSVLLEELLLLSRKRKVQRTVGGLQGVAGNGGGRRRERNRELEL